MAAIDWKKYVLGRWSWKRPFYSLGSIYIILAAVAYFAGHRLLFRPPEASYTTSIEGGDFAAGALVRWLPPASDESPVLFFSHGNAEDMGQQDWLWEECKLRGWGLMLYEYPGYGPLDGVATENSVNAACRAAWQHLTTQCGVPSDRIMLVGRSVGCGPTLELAKNVSAGSVVLLSPFVSAFRSVTRVSLFPGDMFPNEKNAALCSLPVMVIHGSEDRVIPVNQGQRLYEVSPVMHKKFIAIPGADHDDLLDVMDDYESTPGGLMGVLEKWHAECMH